MSSSDRRASRNSIGRALKVLKVSRKEKHMFLLHQENMEAKEESLQYLPCLRQHRAKRIFE